MPTIFPQRYFLSLDLTLAVTEKTPGPINSEALEKKYDAQFRVVIDAIRQLMAPPQPKKRKIGFLVRERAARYGRG